MLKFGITGVGGFVAPRHLQAIQDVGGALVAALDPHDSVGVLDKFNHQAQYFQYEAPFYDVIQNEHVDWVSVCSPNYQHVPQTVFALYAGANVICEKPLSLSPIMLDGLQDAEQKSGRRVYTVLQLRLVPKLIALRSRLQIDPRHREVSVRYVTPRGAWYQRSWKADTALSGGLTTNIGIHMFDLLLWLFGAYRSHDIGASNDTHVSGHLELERANVTWLLSIDEKHTNTGAAERSMLFTLPGEVPEHIDFAEGFTGLHTETYRQILAGDGFGIADARPSVELTARLRGHF